MKTLRVVFLGFAVMALLMTLTGVVFADIEGTVTIAPGDSFVKEAIPPGSIQIVQTSFNASASVRWILTNPTGTIIHNRTYQDWTEADYLSAETYTWTWQNTGSSPVTLNYAITHVAEVQESTDGSVNWWLIGGIAATIIVVIVIAFVFRGRKKKV
jgi:hypothetical protein